MDQRIGGKGTIRVRVDCVVVEGRSASHCGLLDHAIKFVALVIRFVPHDLLFICHS